MLQRSFTSLFLIFALLFAQAAAVQHQSVHYADLAQAKVLQSFDDQRNTDLPNGEKHAGVKLCDQCFNHGELGQALAFSTFKLGFAPNSLPFYSELYTFVTAAHYLAHPARAPPAVLS